MAVAPLTAASNAARIALSLRPTFEPLALLAADGELAAVVVAEAEGADEPVAAALDAELEQPASATSASAAVPTAGIATD
jgi:hypothetical protein